MLGAGEIVKLRPGESLAIPPGTIHQFWGEEGTGEKFHGIGFTLSSEISSLCDDWNDNVFFDSWAVRFPRIAEDVRRLVLERGEDAEPVRTVLRLIREVQAEGSTVPQVAAPA